MIISWQDLLPDIFLDFDGSTEFFMLHCNLRDTKIILLPNTLFYSHKHLEFSWFQNWFVPWKWHSKINSWTISTLSYLYYTSIWMRTAYITFLQISRQTMNSSWFSRQSLIKLHVAWIYFSRPYALNMVTENLSYTYNNYWQHFNQQWLENKRFTFLRTIKYAKLILLCSLLHIL